jgi:hypothetical protein
VQWVMKIRSKLSNLTVITLVSGLIAVLGLAAPTAAQESDKKTDYLEGLKSCQEITDDPLRLQCYDNAVGRVIIASAAGEVRIIDSEDVEKTRRGLFGFSLPKIDLFGSEEEEAELLESVVTNVRVEGRNTVFLTIAEGGAVWRIPGAKPIVLSTKPGDTVEFKKASLGSYFVRINGRLGVKGRRIE